jgi:hypothetical protein
VFANGSRRVQRGVAKCKAPRGEASRLVPVLVPRRCDDHFIPFIPSSIITRSNAAQALEYITLPAGLRGVPYNLLVEAAILKQVFTSCFGLHKSTCKSNFPGGFGAIQKGNCIPGIPGTVYRVYSYTVHFVMVCGRTVLRYYTYIHTVHTVE